MSLYIKVGSITNAQRAKSILFKNSIKSNIYRSEGASQGEGCGYSIKVDAEEETVKDILKNNKIKVLGVENR